MAKFVTRVPVNFVKQSFSVHNSLHPFSLCFCFAGISPQRNIKPQFRLHGHAHLREYPVRFGWKLVDLFGSLTTTSLGQAEVTPEMQNSLDLFKQLPDDDHTLRFAKLDEVYNYLRRCRSLRIPSRWASVVPKARWEVEPNKFAIRMSWVYLIREYI